MFDDMDDAVRAGKILLKNDAEKERLRKEHNVQDKNMRLSVKG